MEINWGQVIHSLRWFWWYQTCKLPCRTKPLFLLFSNISGFLYTAVGKAPRAATAMLQCWHTGPSLKPVSCGRLSSVQQQSKLNSELSTCWGHSWPEPFDLKQPGYISTTIQLEQCRLRGQHRCIIHTALGAQTAPFPILALESAGWRRICSVCHSWEPCSFLTGLLVMQFIKAHIGKQRNICRGRALM